ncbi:MAG: hypothetical protein ACFCVE_05480 [Phycisphaerae bacterium]
MTRVTLELPDDLADRLNDYLRTSGEDLSTFTARVIDDGLNLAEDPVVMQELHRKTEAALKELDVDEGMDKAAFVRLIRQQSGLKLHGHG